MLLDTDEENFNVSMTRELKKKISELCDAVLTKVVAKTVGLKIRFPRNTSYFWAQDQRFFNEPLPDELFEVTRVVGQSVVLSAPGYGGDPYGNGSIYLSVSEAINGNDGNAADRAALSGKA